MGACQGGTQKLPPFGARPDLVRALRDVANPIHRIIEGRTSNSCEFELAASTTKTTVARAYVANHSSIILQPTNAAAASEVASTYVSAVRQGEFDVTHPSNASTRTSSAAWIG